MMIASSDKASLRQLLKSRLANLTAEQRKVQEAKISEHLLKLLSELGKTSLGVYAPMPEEIDCLAFLEPKFQLSFPDFVAGKMQFYTASFSELKICHSFGVELLTPPHHHQVVPEVLIVPGLGFDFQMGRLGRGQGFYDRYMADFNGVSIALAFEEQILDQIPMQEHDRRINYLITQNKIVKGT